MNIMVMKIVDALVREDIINIEKKDIYQFGLKQVFVLLINFGTVLLLGSILDTLFFVILFTFAYMGLRPLAGGYHAETEIRCYIFSTMMMVFVSLVYKYVSLGPIIEIFVIIFCSISIIAIGPVETVTKKLDMEEKLVYGKRLNFVLYIFAIVFIISFYAGFEIGKCTILIAESITLIMMVTGLIKNNIAEIQ